MLEAQILQTHRVCRWGATGAMLRVPAHLQHFQHMRVGQRSSLCFQQVKLGLQHLNAVVGAQLMEKMGKIGI